MKISKSISGRVLKQIVSKIHDDKMVTIVIDPSTQITHIDNNKGCVILKTPESNGNDTPLASPDYPYVPARQNRTALEYVQDNLKSYSTNKYWLDSPNSKNEEGVFYFYLPAGSYLLPSELSIVEELLIKTSWPDLNLSIVDALELEQIKANYPPTKQMWKVQFRYQR